MSPDQRLVQQLRFIHEIDRLKTVLRRTLLTDGSRRENSAEHSWHLALMAVTLAEHAAQPVDTDHVVRLLLVHDLVEIDAGDTFVYDAAARESQAAREAEAARRLFGLLPPAQRDELHALWDEFEARTTPEARFAAALDRLQPILHNVATQGHSWRQHGITVDQVLERNRHVQDGAPRLWEEIVRLVEGAVAEGWLAKG